MRYRHRVDRSTRLLRSLSAAGDAIAGRLRRALDGAGGPPPTRVGGPLDEVNDGFHRAYDEARADAEHEVPVLVVLADSLIVHRRGERREERFSPRAFHVLKAASHAPVAVFSALHRRCGRPLDQATVARLGALLRAIEASRAASLGEIEGEAAQVSGAALRASAAFVERVLREGQCREEALSAFAGECGPALRRTTELATCLQLDALNAAVGRVLEGMSEPERLSFQVVVTGDHQARVRSLAMQYFQTLLGEAPGRERRLTYGEGVVDERAALSLVGTRRLDRALAGAFFGDPTRLQRDLLGDAAQERLRQMSLPTGARG